ncbi:hypothetical protein RchiOBHm_Chr2g0096191 [Rosa chinensis]|uniref:Uncharacterized protein n=1 Tax=Rosa chinensis TaxID=74649 RepID=A0A2P6RKZ6_ROSCH|nr:hypothetical protein RchiOBHm_Chr2g0096191 [Rosa chinensis]
MGNWSFFLMGTLRPSQARRRLVFVEFLLPEMCRTRSIGRLVLLPVPGAWQLWKQNITCKRLDHRRV